MKKGVLIVVALSTLAVVSGCAASSLRMAVPHDIASRSEVLAVSERSQFMPDNGFSLGEYRVSDVERGWTTTTTEGVGPLSREVSTGSYSYSLSKRNAAVSGQCTTGELVQNMDLGSGWRVGQGQKGVTCTCGASARLVISTGDLERTGSSHQESVDVTYESDGKSMSPWFSAGETYKGRLFIGEQTFEVSALHEAEGGISLPEPLGYRVSRGKEFVGMVEVLTPGQMWLAKGMQGASADAMRCLLTGLMFYRPE